MADWTGYTDAELAIAYEEIYAEQAKRARIAVADDQMVQINTQYLKDTGVEAGDAWVQPEGAHDSYPKDWVVTHNDKTWKSTMNGNVWEPGVSGWHEEVVEGEGYPDWVQPTGAHDTYNTGDQVHYVPDDKNYESTIDNNSWSPTDYPAGWTEIP